jgi:hypothetical protein
MEVIVMKIDGEEGSSVVTGVIGASVSPLAGDGLDEAFGLAVGLRAIRFGEAMFEAELQAGCGEEFGAVSGAAVGEDALDFDAVSFVEVEGLLESSQHAGDLFIRAEGGESQAAVIVDGDVETLDSGTRIAKGAITRGPDARTCETAQFLDVEVEEFAGRGAFVAHDRRLGRIEGSEAIEPVTAQDPGEGGLGDRQHHHDLGIGTTGAAQGDDLGFESVRSFAGLALGSRRVIVKAGRKAGHFGASQPAPDGSFADAEGDGRVAQREAELAVSQRHLSSRERGEFGISVHVVRAGWRAVVCASTTSLPNPFRADNVLKRDT